MSSPTIEEISTELKQRIAADEVELIGNGYPAEKRLELLREPYARRNFLEQKLCMFPLVCLDPFL